MKQKKFLGTGIAFFVAILMISTVTAIPASNSNVPILIHQNDSITLDTEIDNLMKDIIENYLDEHNTSIIEKMIYSWLSIRGLNSLIGGCEIIDECNNAYSSEDVKLNIVNGELDLEAFIDNNYVETGWLKTYFALDQTFTLSRIINRIDYLKPLSVLDDIQDLLGVSKDYNNFVNLREDYGEMFLTLANTHNFSTEALDSYYPLIDFICSVLARIALIWAIPLTILFGVCGMIVADLITYVFFAPITIPMTLFVGFNELLKNNDTLGDELMAIAIMYGLVGLFTLGLPLLFKLIFLSEEFMYGIDYVFSAISFFNFIPTIGLTGWDYEADEQAPSINGFTWANIPKPKVGRPVTFSALVLDKDKVQWNGKSVKRDYVRLGIDWNNDMKFDQWTELKKDDETQSTYFEISHIFDWAGTYKINVIAMDIMGGYSDIKTYKVNVQNSRVRDLFALWDFPFFKYFWELIHQSVH
jgi:hypothetical protein